MDGTTGIDNELPTWVVYDNPRDYPGFFVARKRLVTDRGDQPAEALMTATSLKNIRRLIMKKMPGAFKIPRDSKDDPVIVESWI